MLDLMQVAAALPGIEQPEVVGAAVLLEAPEGSTPEGEGGYCPGYPAGGGYPYWLLYWGISVPYSWYWPWAVGGWAYPGSSV